MNPVKLLQDYGQSVWLDFLARDFITEGGLKKLIDQDGVRGVTSNPSIFEKAIGGSNEYDDAIGRLLRDHDRPVGDLFERLAVEDIQRAADALRVTFAATKGADGYVSLEVSPYLAMDAHGTIAEAKRLWTAVKRSNVMIKVPATKPGLTAIHALIAEGINVNITLLFSQRVHEEVVEAYLAGLETLDANGGEVSRVASVASFFVSRIDSAVDTLLDERSAAINNPEKKAQLAALKGKVAVANAKLAYQNYKRLFAGERWSKLAAKGAAPQRLLWASTGTKNKAYSDVLYVEELIGFNTVNTMPPATLNAFRDHGKPQSSLDQGIVEAQKVLDQLAQCGISLETATDKLVVEGVKLFADAADKLFSAVACKRGSLLGLSLDRQTIVLNADFRKSTDAMMEDWRANGTLRRLWRRESGVWTGGEESRWLGWLDSIDAGIDQANEYGAFAWGVKREGFTDALLIGMGGSSLGPEVLSETFGHSTGWPRLRVLDSIDPAQVRAAESAIDLGRTLFIVSSKSGGTAEPNILKDYFHARLVETRGRDVAGRHFVVITDPGSSLEEIAKHDGFRYVFLGDPSIGGRYSILSPFGLVPAALAGIDVTGFLEAAKTMARSCGPDVPPAVNPGVELGLAMGVACQRGCDKVTILASPGLRAFGAWAEQLIAESTGKNGKGLIPVDGEPLGVPEVYGQDRFFIDLRLDGETDRRHDALLNALEQAGHPVTRIALNSVERIGQEFFRFEIATAVASAVLGVNPFDQPDVEASKLKTRELIAIYEKSGRLPEPPPVVSGPTLDLYADNANAEALRKAGAGNEIEGWLRAHFARLRPGDYAALLAYVARDETSIGKLQTMRVALRDTKHVATCVGFGPRFLHSTGQAYKGGPDTGVFLQITAEDVPDLAIPGHRTSFGVVKAAQASGDFAVLAERGRRVLRVHLKGGTDDGLDTLGAAIRRALA